MREEQFEQMLSADGLLFGGSPQEIIDKTIIMIDIWTSAVMWVRSISAGRILRP